MADIERALAAGEREALRGQLEGLTGAEPAGSDVRRAGILTGRLYRRLLTERHRLDGALMLAAAIYGSNVAQAGTLPADDRALVKEHTVGCLRIDKRGHGLDEQTELALLRWLAGEAGIALTSELLARCDAIRVRRISGGSSRGA